MNLKNAPRLVFSVLVALPCTLLAQYPQSSGIPVSAEMPSHTVNQTSPGASSNSTSMQDSSMNGSVSDDTQLAKDMLFVRKAEEGGLAQVEFGKLAVKQGGSDGVKKLGQKMVDDHTSLAANLDPLADSLGVRIPEKLSKADQLEYNKLAALSGTDFDKAYLAVALKDHRKDMRDFRSEANTTMDPELKEASANAVKLIAEHLFLVNQLALANGVPGAYKPKAQPVVATTATPQ
jgi:putative membrane protein